MSVFELRKVGLVSIIILNIGGKEARSVFYLLGTKDQLFKRQWESNRLSSVRLVFDGFPDLVSTYE